jgi:hypothetical protein
MSKAIPAKINNNDKGVTKTARIAKFRKFKLNLQMIVIDVKRLNN